MKAMLVCLDIECGAILTDRAWILSILSNVSIKKMQAALKVKGIESTTHESVEFVHISIYFPGVTKDESAILACITREIHLIDDLKTKMLIDNDFFDPEEFIIDIEGKSAAIESCEIKITLKIQPKESYVRKIVHAQQDVMLQSGEERLIAIKANISEERDFFFESESKTNFIMCSHILDVSIKKILIKNEINHLIKMSRRYRLGQIFEIDCDNCFQIAEMNLAVRPPKRYKSEFTSAVVPTTDLTDMEARLFNEFTIYDDNKARSAFAELIQEFPSL